MKNKIAIIGLGYVGLPLFIEFSKKNYVIGFDINKSRIDELNKKYDKNHLIAKKDFIFRNSSFLTNNKKDLKNSNIFIVTVPTPVTKNKKPDLSYLNNASKIIAPFLKRNDLVIYESTVYPGVTEDFCIPVLHKYSKLRTNKDFFVGHSPERVSPGDKKKLKDISRVVSCNSAKGLNRIHNLYKLITNAKIYKAKSIKIAEASKILENVQRDINISFMNEMSLIFSKLNINTNEVIQAAKTKWNFLNFHPGLVGGHCISVDPYYLTYIAKKNNYQPKVLLSGRKINEKMGITICKILEKKLKKLKREKKVNVGIYGVTFKENINDLRDSKIIEMVKYLRKNQSINLYVNDPNVSQKEFSKIINFKINNKIPRLDALVLAVKHKEFKKINYDFLKKKMIDDKSIIIDVKSFLSDEKIKKKFNYWSL